MSTDTIFQINTSNSSETEAIGAKLAHNLHGGEIIELKSDVGGGKTTLVGGVVAELGSTDHVSSPTFTIEKEYVTSAFRVVHFDFYRMTDPGLIAYALKEVIADSKTVCFIEWGGIVEGILPKNRVRIIIQKDPKNESVRTLTLQATEDLAYVLKGVKSE